MNGKTFGIGIGLFLILMSQLFVIYHEGQIASALDIVLKNQKILNEGVTQLNYQYLIAEDKATLDSLKRVSIGKLTPIEKKEYIAKLDTVISHCIVRKSHLDSIRLRCSKCQW